MYNAYYILFNVMKFTVCKYGYGVNHYFLILSSTSKIITNIWKAKENNAANPEVVPLCKNITKNPMHHVDIGSTLVWRDGAGGIFETKTYSCGGTVLVAFKGYPYPCGGKALAAFETNTYSCGGTVLVVFDVKPLPLWWDGIGGV